MKSVSVVLFVAGLAIAQAQEAPWSRDAAAIRQSALRDKRPCVLLINSDMGAL